MCPCKIGEQTADRILYDCELAKQERDKLKTKILPSENRPVSKVPLSQMQHQLDATLCRFYFCRVTLHVSGASVHHQEYLKLVQRPLLHVLSL